MIIPKNQHIEQAIIGSILQSNDLYDKVSSIIKPIFFFENTHRTLFEIILKKLNNGMIANVITIMDESNKKGINIEYIMAIIDNTIIVDNILEYSKILRDLYIKREVISLCQYMIEQHENEEFLTKIILNFEEKLFGLLSQDETTKTLDFQEGSKMALNYIASIVESNKKIVGLTTGFIDLDKKIGGLHKGELVIIAGRPSMGKTAFATNIAVNIAMDKEYGSPVAFLSLEMPHHQIFVRIISSLTEIPSADLINCRINKESLSKCIKKIQEFINMPFFIHDNSNMTIGEIRTLLRNMKRKHNIGVAVIDYLQLINGNYENRSDNRVNEVSRITRNLKSIAKELNIPIVVLSQLSRSTEKREENRPRLSDLRESGSIEQDADVVMFVYRESYYNKSNDHNDEGDVSKILIEKNRNGSTGEINLLFNKTLTKFENYFSAF